MRALPDIQIVSVFHLLLPCGVILSVVLAAERHARPVVALASRNAAVKVVRVGWARGAAHETGLGADVVQVSVVADNVKHGSLLVCP